ncbi:MAG: DNA repair protein RecN [Prevotella sp.]|jgi:DNA repair protein RecN (Recombination protein N)|nr:DNA repair protein RecN [Prevotella sp.]MCI1281764.1 DNA repair protein RecN [Prevotella sp.]
MLRQLYIQHFALIDELNIHFKPGFSVITGETGAGKSIILGAIGLLLGNRADAKQIKVGEDKCIIEAHFDLSKYNMQSFFEENDLDYDDTDCILRREINSNGKSRAFINDIPVGLTIIRELGEHLIDIHSQHQNLLLQKENFQLNVVDIFANDKQQITIYKQALEEYRDIDKRLSQLKENIAKIKENEEYFRFQVDELEKANLSEGQQEQLEEESSTLTHAEEIKTALYEADNALNNEDNGIVAQLKSAIQTLNNVCNVYHSAKVVNERLDSAYIELKDIAEEINKDIEDIDFDPQRLENINTQLDTIYSLQQKFHVDSVRDLLDILADLKQQLHSIEYNDEEIAALENEKDKQLKNCIQLASKLTELRKKASKQIEEDLKKRLIPLGIPNIRFQVDFSPKTLSEDGADKIQFLFSANKSTPLQPISEIASGGEISRVMLSLKAMISSAVKLPTIIFDEIDTGVSGKVAEMMALIMKEMGENDRQVISITHLPQIAAMGSTHYRVTKEETSQGTLSEMKELSQEERIHEIAQMLSGNNISNAAIENAKSLLRI